MLEAGLVFVFVMEVAKDVNMKAVGKVHKDELISVKHMVAVNAAHGFHLNLRLVKYRPVVINLLEGKPVFVLFIVNWLKITSFLDSFHFS